MHPLRTLLFGSFPPSTAMQATPYRHASAPLAYMGKDPHTKHRHTQTIPTAFPRGGRRMGDVYGVAVSWRVEEAGSATTQKWGGVGGERRDREDGGEDNRDEEHGACGENGKEGD
ncbi:hypothetical protein C8R44DRAFT_744230 [Mycena epipterygia]|nr:hypothetical protein C8R44DRAFT_744230 [Mycena epipterygia]